MVQKCLVLTAVLLSHVSDILMDCRIFQTVKDVDQYKCDTVQELREQGGTHITILKLYNDLSYPVINTETFQKTPNLEMVELENAVTAIKPNTFKDLKNINRIMINHNKYLESISSGTFENLSVTYINLDNNRINTVEADAFINLPKLHTLRLAGNNLRKISSGIFNNLTVDTLSLSKNRISIIEANAFMDMENLRRLHLDGNLLSEFEPESLLNHGSKLQILWLQNNSFTTIDQFTFKGLDNLTLLNLQDNKISEIGSYTFNWLLNLDVLVLSNNSLAYFNADIFPRKSAWNLQKLYLNDNKLSFLTTKVLGKLTNLKNIYIGGNPWQCPCWNNILTWISDHEIKQKCDGEYLSGLRPSCIVTDTNPTTCVYTNDLRYFNIYRETIDKIPKLPPCAL